MLTFELALRAAPRRIHTPAAWFIPGADPNLWLAEICRWTRNGSPIAMTSIRVIAIPASPRDRQPCGALIMLPSAHEISVSPLAQAYGRIAERLYLPADARLAPEVSDDELRAKLVWPFQVLHPAAGLVGFKESNAVKLHTLLSPPTQVPAEWNRAQPGITLNSRLISVEPLEPQSVDTILRQGQGDIGSQAIQPPNARSRRGQRNVGGGGGGGGGASGSGEDGAAEKLGSLAGQAAMKTLGWLANMAGPVAPEWMRRLQEWSSEKLSAWNRKLEDERSKELERLVGLLERDPDQALRYALPLHSEGRNRGIAAPGTQLTQRDTNFDLSRIGAGGAPADPWSVPFEIQQRLRDQYRIAANRELALGRYRRAAYIFAELLGDYPSAASALRQGRFFREAAILYRDHLKQTQAAAECLLEGGLLLEAIPLYESLKMFVKVGELYMKLERPDEAAKAYRKAVDDHRSRGELLAAAKLLEQPLKAPDEALAVLATGWPHSDQARECVKERFALFGRLGRHEAAGQWVRELRTNVPVSRTGLLAEAFVAVSQGYPHAPLRAQIGDATRVIIGRRLPNAELVEAESLVATLTRIAPDDRLLGRDTNRYTTLRRKATTPAPPPKKLGKGPTLLRTLNLPSHRVWVTAVSGGDHFFAAGYDAVGPVVLRGNWDGVLQNHWWILKLASDPEFVIEAPRHGASPVMAWLPGNPPLASRTLPATDHFAHAPIIGTPSWLPKQARAVCYDEHDTAWVAEAGDVGISVSSHGANGLVLASKGEMLPIIPPNGALPMVARQGNVFLGIERSLFRVTANGHWQASALRENVVAMTATAPFIRLRVAIAMAEGGLVLWPQGEPDPTRLPFGEGLFSPKIAFTRDGTLIAATPDEGRIYHTVGEKIVHAATFDGPRRKILAVAAAAGLNEFAIFTDDGAIRVYRVE